MSNRSPKRSLLTERKVRSVIREEINTRYGNRLTERQKAVLEEDILGAMRGLFGGVKKAVGVAGTEAAGLAQKATGAVGDAAVNMARALQTAAKPVTDSLQKSGAEIAKAFASGKIPAVKVAIEKLDKELDAAKKQLTYLQQKAAGTPAVAAATPPATEESEMNKLSESLRRMRRI